MNEVQRFNRTINEKPAQVGCTDGAVNHEDLEMALECLSAWCEVNQIPPHTGEHCIVGDSMMYMCSYGDYNPCSADEIVTAWGAIQRDCGTNRGGWWHFHDWKKTYGVDVSGADVCSNM
ncbi:hypothetical protein QBC35DRAFT_386085 [Podospora australis]|uniref:Uncharacterized protein n=1 Tax=Podospora australis TaxID=1536484 RepID=A0AAN7AII8_9PEZI|nr:hypothetical protein QBC35DRAFT_386085 [Podospora australis]